jgi:hypothetical protein
MRETTGALLTRIPQLVGTVRCAVPAPHQVRNEYQPTCFVAQFLPTAPRGRRQRGALSLPRQALVVVTFHFGIQFKKIKKKAGPFARPSNFP